MANDQQQVDSTGLRKGKAAKSRTVESRNRLQRIFVVLAILNIVTAIGALSISQITLFMLRKQQQDGVTWNERVEELLSLRDVVALMDSPANAIFQSKDVPLERRRL